MTFTEALSEAFAHEKLKWGELFYLNQTYFQNPFILP